MDIKLNLSYYAIMLGIMLDAFKDLLCSKLCWHNRPGPTSMHVLYGQVAYYMHVILVVPQVATTANTGRKCALVY